MAKVVLTPMDTWPELRVTVVPLPWCWRLRPRFYRDDVDGGFYGHSSFEWLFLRLEWWNNRPMFIERTHTNDDTTDTPEQATQRQK